MPAAGAQTAQTAEEPYRQYTVYGASTPRERTEVAATGAAIDDVQSDAVVITATAGEAAAVEQLGFEVEPLGLLDANVLPPGYGGYHDYAEMTQAVNQLVADHPTIARQQVIGQSYEGRNIVAVKISDNVSTDEGEPEVLFTSSQHAREILTVEMALYIMNQLTDGYGSDSRVTGLVDSREIWVVPNVNPDGSEYDKTSTGFRSWRKNRQPNSGTTAVGTDLNRNWDYLWGCCGGSSGTASSQTYRGSSPESAPEVGVVADFVRSRVVGGVQQITAHIDWHTYGELILFPYGYTYADTGPGLNATDRQAFQALGNHMGQTNGYTVEQASDLYITDGTIDDWMWGVHGIFSYTFEMYPTGSSPGFYPSDTIIGQETSRNREAVLRLLDYADCPYEIISVSCGPPAPAVWSDDFETDRGWVRNPNGNDTATAGLWERGDPQATSSSGTQLQLGSTASGTNALTTGPLAGSSAGTHDVDSGVTRALSPDITLPGTGDVSLTASWYLAHLNNASSADYFRVSVVSGGTTTQVFQQVGAASNRAGSWGPLSANLNQWRGQTVRILVEAADASGGSLVEAAVDDVKITQG
jgi:hypothetical protein